MFYCSFVSEGTSLQFFPVSFQSPQDLHALFSGEESLRKCFEYFEELDIDYHKRFFRCLAIHDNVIKSKEHLQHEDRIHELLNIWMEKVGKEANLNDLLQALLELKQKLTAENIRDNAISNGHYVYEKE